MKVRVVLELSVDDGMPLAGLAVGLPVMLEARDDVVRAEAVRIVVHPEKPYRPPPARPLGPGSVAGTTGRGS